MCEPTVTKTISCEDIEATVPLPVQITKQRCSRSLREYTKSKEHQHEGSVERMRTDLETINLASAKELKELREILEEEIREADTKMSKCFEGELNTIEQWRGVQEKMDKLSQRIMTLLDEFSLDLTNLEKTRCEQIKNVLGKYKLELKNIQWLSPENVEQTFEDIVSEMNRSTLKHLTHHEDLKLKFQIEGEDIISKRLLQLKCRVNELADIRANELWGKVKHELIRGEVAEAILSLEEEDSKPKEELYQAYKYLMENVRNLVAALEVPKIKDKDEELWGNLLKEVELNFENVNLCYLNFDKLLKSFVTNVVQSFDREKDALAIRLRDNRGDGSLEGCPLELAALGNKKDGNLTVLEFLQMVLDELGNTLKKTKPCVMDIILFWQRNSILLNKTRSDWETSFESSYQRCLKKEQEFSSKIKTQMKALREAPDNTKLEASYKAISEVFLGLSNMWDENFQSSFKTLEDFKNNNMHTIVQQLASEAIDLVFIYPKELWIFQENLWLDTPECQPNYSNSLAFECIDYINLLEAKTLNIYEDLEKFAPFCEYEITDKYTSLLDDVTKCINDKNENIFFELNSKIQNFEDVKKIRFGELEIHSERLKSHQAGVKLILNDVTTMCEEIKSDQKLKLYEYNENLKTVHETLSTETRDQLNNAISVLELEWNSLSTLLENRILDAKMLCQHKFETLKHSNDSFRNVAKHFKNGGNFSQNELTSLTKELKLLEKTFSSQEKTLSNEYNSLIKDISRHELDDIIKTLQDKLKLVSLNNKIGEILGLTRMKLRKEVHQIQTAVKLCKSKIQHFGSLRKLDEELLDEIVSLTSSIYDDLVYTLPLECGPKNKKSSSPAPLSKKDNKSVRKKSVKISLTPKSLFTNITDEDLKDVNNFLARAKLIMSEKYAALVQVIEDTLKPKPVEAPKSKKKESKKDIEIGPITEKIEIITQVLTSYNKECESIWFNQARELINQLIVLRNTFNDLSKHIFDEIHSAHVDTLATTESEYKPTASKLLTEGTSEIDKIRKSIVLPLAHPSYQHKLEELYQQAKLVTGSIMNDIKELTCNYRDDLQRQHDDYVKNIATLRDTLESSQRKCFDNFSVDAFTLKLEEVEEFLMDQPVVVENENANFGWNLKAEVETDDRNENTEMVNVENEDNELPKYPMSIWSDEEESGCIELQSQSIEREHVQKNSIITMATLKLKDSVEMIQRLYKTAEEDAKESLKRIANCMRNIEYDINEAKLVYCKICK